MDEFPNELLLQIFSLLHTPITCFSSPRVPAPSRDLLALCRVCRVFRDVARSLIYESIERAGDMNSGAFRQLPRTLLENMELCGYIKNLRLKMEDGFEVGDFWAGHSLRLENELDDEDNKERATQDTGCIRYERRHQNMLDGNGSDVDKGVSDLPEYTPEGYEWLGELIPAMDSSQAHANDHDLLERAILGEDVLLTPCILAACNLERLWLRLPKSQLDEGSSSFLLNSIVHSAHEGGFERLKVLHLDIHQSDLEWPVRDVLPFFLLPSLTDLTLGNCGEIAPGESQAFGPDNNDSTSMRDPWKWPVRNSSIARLSLLSPRFSGSIAAKMILACRAVTEFEVVVPCHDPPSDPEFYEHIGIALAEHADTLVKLSLGDQLAASGRSRSNRLGMYSESTRLSSLTSLRVNPNVFLPYESGRLISLQPERDSALSNAIPNTIEHLWLDLPYRPWNMDMRKYFQGLYEARRNGRLPQLRSIFVHWQQKFKYDWDVITHYIRDLMDMREDAAGISFEFYVRIACRTSGKTQLIIHLHESEILSEVRNCGSWARRIYDLDRNQAISDTAGIQQEM